jgi:hypothetical protein
MVTPDNLFATLASLRPHPGHQLVHKIVTATARDDILELDSAAVTA